MWFLKLYAYATIALSIHMEYCNSEYGTLKPHILWNKILIEKISRTRALYPVL
jgi:hypothetical protein